LNRDGQILWPNSSSASSNYTNFIFSTLAEQVLDDFNNESRDSDNNNILQNTLFLSNAIREPPTDKTYSLMLYPQIENSNHTDDSVSGIFTREVMAALIRFDHDNNNRASMLNRQSSDEVKQNIVMLADSENVILESNNNSLIGMPISHYFNQITT
jgi:hypothetical protein